MAVAADNELLPKIDIRSGRVGDFQFMFDSGRESFIKHSSMIEKYSKDAQDIALANRVITSSDLKALNCKDYASAARLVCVNKYA